MKIESPKGNTKLHDFILSLNDLSVCSGSLISVMVFVCFVIVFGLVCRSIHVKEAGSEEKVGLLPGLAVQVKVRAQKSLYSQSCEGVHWSLCDTGPNFW